jgi:hypothetical protein
LNRCFSEAAEAAVRALYLVSLIGSLALAASGFLPWLRIGDLGLVGVPDPAGLFVVAIGGFGVLLSVLGIASGRDWRQLLVLAGLAGLTTLTVVWRTGPLTVAERAQARADAIAIVDNLPPQTAPPVRPAFGLFVGLTGALAVAASGLTVLRQPRF